MNTNRTNTMFDNDLNRVVERAKRHGITPVAWQAVSTTTEDVAIIDPCELPQYERLNNVGLAWRLSPIFDPKEADINGNPV